MTADHFQRSLRAFSRRTPFRPFVVELVSSARVRIDHPDALALRGGMAVFVDPDGAPSFFDHESVSQGIDSNKSQRRS